MGKVTLKELAERTGFSVSAVSLALNNRPGISPENRDRILQTANELGYCHRKTKIAAQKAKEIAVIYHSDSILTTRDIVFPQLMKSISNAAEAAGWTIRLHFRFLGKPLNPEAFRNCAGILVLTKGNITMEEIHELQAFQLPMVLLDHYYPHLCCDAVTIDNTQAINQAFDWLRDHGYHRIALLSHAPDHRDFNTYNSTAREHAYHSCAVANGMDPLFFRVQKDNERSSFIHWYQSLTAKPDAYLLTMDYLALQMLPVMSALKINIGSDCAMIGVDNLLFCETTVPPLSSIDANCAERGIVAFRRLLEIIREPDSVPQHISVGTHLVLRESTPDQSCI